MRNRSDIGTAFSSGALGVCHMPCPQCTSPGPHVVAPGAGPHHARLVCGQCGRWLRWLPKQRPVAQEVR